jgi:hypothetical protein
MSSEAIQNPPGFLRAAVHAVPAVKYALGIGGIIAVIAIVASFGIGFRVAIFGTVVMLVLMVVLVIFAGLAGQESSSFHAPAIVFTWFSLILFMAVAVVLFTSVFWGKPVDLRSLLGVKAAETKIEPGPPQTATGNGSTNTAGNINQNQNPNSNAAVGSDNFQNSGNITVKVAPCGIAQVGNKNRATVNCAPPSGAELAKFGAGIVVQIEGNTSSSETPIATGFWLNKKGYVATCFHSLVGKTDLGATVPIPPKLGTSFTLESGGLTTGVEMIASDADTDVAIIHVLNSPFERSMHGIASLQKLDAQGRAQGQPEVTTEQYWVPTLAKVLAHDGDEIIKIGLIQQDDSPVVAYDFGHIARMGVDASHPKASHRIVTSFSYKDSDCGAPVMNNANTVVGMMHGPNGEAIPSTYIFKLLDKVHQ